MNLIILQVVVLLILVLSTIQAAQSYKERILGDTIFFTVLSTACFFLLCAMFVTKAIC
jgi:hypothetical protein